MFIVTIKVMIKLVCITGTVSGALLILIYLFITLFNAHNNSMK
jgi:hypothetical protein